MSRPARRLALLNLVDTARDAIGGGRHSQAVQLMRGLAGRGHDVVLAAPAGAGIAVRAETCGARVAPVPASGPAGWLALRRLLRSQRWDIVHLHDAVSLRRLVRAERLLVGAARPACVLGVRGDIAYASRAPGAGARLSRVTQFWAVSEWVWSALVRGGIAEERISVIHSGVDLDRFTDDPRSLKTRRAETRAGLGLAGEDFVVGTAMSLLRGRGLEQLIEACRMIRTGETPPGEPRLRLLVAGDGPDRARLEAIAGVGGGAGSAIFTGFREDISGLLAAMDVYAHPAPSGDGFPIALREAMAMAVPVVATDLMGIREIIDNGRHGLIVPPSDPQALARNIMRLRRDEAFAHEVGRAGCLKVQRYSLKSMVERAEELYLRLVR